MKPRIQDLIKSCNDCILSCEAALKTCKGCIKSCTENTYTSSLAENCSVECQKTVEACHHCMHECNQALANKLYDTPKQEAALRKCLEACKDSMKKCQISTTKILDKEGSPGCEWAVESLNKCVSACDECIESFEG